MDFQWNTTDERPKETGTRASHPSPLEGNPPQEPKIHSKASMATGEKKGYSNKSLHLRMGRMDGRVGTLAGGRGQRDTNALAPLGGS